MQLATSVVVITGASRGLGLAIARLCAKAGARLALTARGPEDLRRAAQEFAQHTEVLTLPGDVGQSRACRRARRRHGPSVWSRRRAHQ